MKRLLFIIVFMTIALFSSTSYSQSWWKSWNNYPKVPKISASDAKLLSISGENVVFVYAGYNVSEILCGSLYIPFTLVPPNADGSRIKLNVPKDWWIICYCP